ncbi:MAG: hypothetical protein Kow0077_06850 [Anaerolineae bacterium]
MKKETSKYGVLLGVVLLLMVTLQARATVAQTGVNILADEVLVRYPLLINFQLEAEAPGTEITDVRLMWQAGPEDAFNVTRMSFQPAERVAIQYPLNVQFLRLPPFATVSYRWELRTADGELFTTEVRSFEYEDSRKDWQVLENERIRLLWYDLSLDTAEDLFDLADAAYQRLAADFGVELTHRPKIVIYSDQRDFTEFQSMMGNVEFVVGRYFPGHNITVNLVTPEIPRRLYADTLAHELSHLYSDNFYVGFASLPLWLEEGLATYNEREDLSEELRRVQHAAEQGFLIPFIELPDAIRDRDISVSNLAYAEGATIFMFIRDRWGQAHIVKFLEAFRQTTDVNRVLQDIFGQSMAEFEIAWREWLGFPVESVPELQPTATLRPLIFPTPTYGFPGG